MNVKALLIAATVATATIASADQIQWINSWRDVQGYLKPKYDMVRTFDQEFGVQATVAKYGRFREQLNFTWDPTYPIRLGGSKPRWSFGEQTTYLLNTGRYQPGIYTKFKNNLIGTWKDESGVTAHIFSYKRNYMSANFAYIYNLPFSHTAKPQWLALVNFVFPLG